MTSKRSLIAFFGVPLEFLLGRNCSLARGSGGHLVHLTPRHSPRPAPITPFRSHRYPGKDGALQRRWLISIHLFSFLALLSDYVGLGLSMQNMIHVVYMHIIVRHLSLVFVTELCDSNTLKMLSCAPSHFILTETTKQKCLESEEMS